MQNQTESTRSKRNGLKYENATLAKKRVSAHEITPAWWHSYASTCVQMYNVQLVTMAQNRQKALEVLFRFHTQWLGDDCARVRVNVFLFQSRFSYLAVATTRVIICVRTEQENPWRLKVAFWNFDLKTW